MSAKSGFVVVVAVQVIFAAGLASAEDAARAPAAEQAEIARLLQMVQDQIEVDARLGGALVLDARLVDREEEEGRDLRVRGKFIDEDQPPLLSEVFAMAMEADPYWRERQDEVSVDLEGMPIIPPSPELAARYYGFGLRAFWRNDFINADRSFTRAIAEAPDVAIYRYWSVLTAIALSQDARAQYKLRPLIWDNPFGSSSAGIARELERVQGPLRWRLRTLEKGILLHGLPTETPDFAPPPVEAEVRTGPLPVPTARVHRSPGGGVLTGGSPH